MSKLFHRMTRFICLCPLPFLSPALREKIFELAERFYRIFRIVLSKYPFETVGVIIIIIILLLLDKNSARIYAYDLKGQPQYVGKLPILFDTVYIPMHFIEKAETGRFYVQLFRRKINPRKNKQLLILSHQYKKAFELAKIVHFDL